jgi:hypothetical protein
MRVSELLAEKGSGQRERITVAGELLTCMLAQEMVQRSSKLPSHSPSGPPNQLIVADAPVPCWMGYLTREIFTEGFTAAW